ncbi:MAG TPA: hypothetical protein DHV15_10615 [Treponema sp.]|uniref:Uncharacterized protein n=1 Tax=Treponema denticola (strain ATCC 35405 / DSM 14222 / CIP 103919 / JCM 8153 / KCTC 15104) TaxID=243275 RepID=Q73LJ4_TREDE|nr:hypothetical protein TDE_1868 [Treponema denticola ATCC 35405]HCY95938.1 hypothetical protein [Treponema sp.]
MSFQKLKKKHFQDNYLNLYKAKIIMLIIPSKKIY